MWQSEGKLQFCEMKLLERRFLSWNERDERRGRQRERGKGLETGEAGASAVQREGASVADSRGWGAGKRCCWRLCRSGESRKNFAAEEWLDPICFVEAALWMLQYGELILHPYPFWNSGRLLRLARTQPEPRATMRWVWEYSPPELLYPVPRVTRSDSAALSDCSERFSPAPPPFLYPSPPLGTSPPLHLALPRADLGRGRWRLHPASCWKTGLFCARCLNNLQNTRHACPGGTYGPEAAAHTYLFVSLTKCGGWRAHQECL